MKKMLSLALVLALIMMFSVGVMALDPVDPERTGDDTDFEYNVGTFENRSPLTEPFFDVDTSIITEGEDVPYVTIVNLDPTVIPTDYNSYAVGDQEGKIIIPAIANIPCYLEMELYGNGGWTKIKSLGATAGTHDDEVIDWNASGRHFMLFDARMGGFLDDDWNAIDASSPDSVVFSTVPGAYITACDLWTANLTSNLPYGLKVSADSLANKEDNNKTLDVEMRYTHNNNPQWYEFGNISQNDANFGGSSGYQALSDTSITMQFRVPFNGTEAGSYTGDVTFKAYTI